MKGKKGRRKARSRKTDGTWDVGPLRVRGNTGWRLRRTPRSPKNSSNRREVVSRVLGWKSDVLLPLLVETVQREGYKASSMSERKRPYLISEEEGYRLALGFELVRKTKSLKRAESMVDALRGFEVEEAYLWYAYFSRASSNGKESRLASSLAYLGEALR